MTRKIGKSAKFSAVVALLVLMVMGIDEVFADNQALIDLHEFHGLLIGIGAEIETVNGQPDTVAETSSTIPIADIISEISYLEAFDEVIKKQIL